MSKVCCEFCAIVSLSCAVRYASIYPWAQSSIQMLFAGHHRVYETAQIAAISMCILTSNLKTMRNPNRAALT